MSSFSSLHPHSQQQRCRTKQLAAFFPLTTIIPRSYICPVMLHYFIPGSRPKHLLWWKRFGKCVHTNANSSSLVIWATRCCNCMFGSNFFIDVKQIWFLLCCVGADIWSPDPNFNSDLDTWLCDINLNTYTGSVQNVVSNQIRVQGHICLTVRCNTVVIIIIMNCLKVWTIQSDLTYRT